MLSLVQNSKVKTQGNLKGNVTTASISSKKSSSSSLTTSTMATIGSSNGGINPESRRTPSFTYNSDETGYKEERGIDVGSD